MKPLRIAAAIIAFAIPLDAQAPPGPVAPPQMQSSPQPSRVYSEASTLNEGPQVSGKFGGLKVTVTKLALASPSSFDPDHTALHAFVTVDNKGRGAICADLKATLDTTFNLNYSAYDSEKPRVDQMLPGETKTGNYEFYIKQGVKPLAIVFRVGSMTLKGYRDMGTWPSLRCGDWRGAREDEAIPLEARLDISNLPIATPPQQSNK